MTISFGEFLSEMIINPTLMVITVLTLLVIILNGGMDAGSTVSTCVSTHSVNPKNAVVMAAVFNLLGLVAVTAVNMKVAQTIYELVDFNGTYRHSIIGLCSALLAMMIWTLLAYQYKIPTSESHSVIAAITGAAVAVSGNIFCINFGQWTKVLYGIILSLVIAFLWGWLIIKVTAKIFGFVDRRKTFVHFKHGQIASAAALSFMHGAQDGQKFVGVFLIGIFLSADHVMSENFYVPLWLVVLCGAFMAMGTFYGGRRMRKAVGLLSIKVEKYQGFSIDLGATLCLFGASLWGIPMSMKHTKISALLGVEAAKGFYSLDFKVFREMLISLILVFPGCGIIAYGLTVFLINVI